MPLSMEVVVDLGPGNIVAWDPTSPHHGNGRNTPTFRPMSIVAKRSPISATAELLFGMLRTCYANGRYLTSYVFMRSLL